MPIIKLHKRVYSRDREAHLIPIGWEAVLLNTDTIIKVENAQGFTHILHNEGKVNGFTCKESMDEILNLINDNTPSIN